MGRSRERTDSRALAPHTTRVGLLMVSSLNPVRTPSSSPMVELRMVARRLPPRMVSRLQGRRAATAMRLPRPMVSSPSRSMVPARLPLHTVSRLPTGLREGTVSRPHRTAASSRPPRTDSHTAPTSTVTHQYGNQPPAIAPQGYGDPYQQEPPKKKSRGPLIAGITAGVVAVIAIIVVVVLFAAGVIGGKKDSSADAKPNTSTSQTQGDSKSNGDNSSNGNSDGSSSNDLNNLDDALQNGADDTNNDLNNDSFNGSSSSGKPSLEEFVNSSEIQSQLDSMTSSYQGMGISIKAYAEGNTLVYDYTLSDTYSSMGDMMTSSLDGMDSTFKSVAQTLNETCDTGGNAKVRVYLHTESGKTLFDKSYTE